MERNPDESNSNFFKHFWFKGQTNVQIPSKYCSSERLPKPSREELATLSELGLGAPLYTESTENNTPEHQEMTSKINPDASSSSTEYHLQKTDEEYNELNEKTKKKKLIKEFYND